VGPPRGGKVDADAPAVEVDAVEVVDGPLGVVDRGHGDKAEAARATRARLTV